MVDIEYLQKNYLNYDVEVVECLENIRNDFEEYSMAKYEGDKEDVREYQNDIYTELIFLLAYLHIAGIDFGSRQFKEDVYSTLQYLEKCERKRRGENEHQ